MSETQGPGYPDQKSKRLLFRTLGVVLMAAALGLIATALVDFFAGFSDDPFAAEGPDRFWMFFAALPCFVVGGFLLQLGFGGAVARYGAGEAAPVLKDTARYLSDGRGVLGVGVDGEHAGVTTAGAGPYCRQCGTRNDGDARFCDACGAGLG